MLLEDVEPMKLVELQQAGAVTQQQGGPPQLAAGLWLPGEEQHTEAGGLRQAEAVPGLKLLAVAGAVSERAALEFDQQWVPAVQAHVAASVFEWDGQMVCSLLDTQSPGWCC